MSAWIVSRDHLDLLITAAVAWRLTTTDEAHDIGRTLWRENLASVAHRYPADRDGTRPGPADFRDRHVDTYQFQHYPGRVDPDVVTAAAASLDYQSREHPAWPGSAAREWVHHLHAAATVRIPGYRAQYGPVDPSRRHRSEREGGVRTTRDDRRNIRSSDGWDVPDRGVFQRAALLRATPQRSPSDTTPRPTAS